MILERLNKRGTQVPTAIFWAIVRDATVWAHLNEILLLTPGVERLVMTREPLD